MDNVKKNVKKLYAILIVIFICGAVALILRNNWDRVTFNLRNNWDRSGMRYAKERLAEARAKKRANKRAQKQKWKRPRGDCVYNNRISYGLPKQAGSFLPFLKVADGIKFTVENVPRPSRKNLHKRRLTKKEYMVKNRMVKNRRGRVEQISNMPPNLVSGGSRGFFAACLTAYAEHLPLRLSPDDIWQVILHGFKIHVDLHAEKLRHKFVAHEGKKTLLVQTEEDFPCGNGDLSQAAPAARWESEIFPDFAAQIKSNTNGTVHATVATPFSTSTVAAAAAHEITLMSTMRHYFDYRMETECGIPSITLSGTRQDWLDIRTRAEQLGELMMTPFRKKWMPILLPILDEFVRAYTGQASAKFWPAMINIRDEEILEDDGCYIDSYAPKTPYTYYTGWLNNLFPYLKENQVNEALQPWEEMVRQGGGADPGGSIPDIMSSADVIWDYFGELYKMRFHSGFVGFTQDSDGTLAPAIGWAVTHVR